MSDEKPTAFEKESQAPQQNLPQEFIAFLKQNKKYWMIPLLLTLLGIALLVILGGTAAAPFIYTLF